MVVRSLPHPLNFKLHDSEMIDQIGFAYYGANAAKVGHLEKGIKWDKFLSNPGDLRIEDSTMPLQDYP